MVKRMLIDATHPEETRMAIIEDNKLLEFESETQSRRALKGNVYLAKVVRVEPSLQAAFVEYGGNRHGFLPFSEIHPDYFRIPVSDREKLIEEERARAKEEADALDEDVTDEENADGDAAAEETEAPKLAESTDEKQDMKPRSLHRLYKIQEVINKGQVMLIQVVKEERGAKGASLTTYLSLPGRYSVLMPNAIRTAGISRKITNVKDRKRLKAIVEEFNLPDSMGAIIRTAGLERTKREIKRDLTYLLNLWNEIREKTLESVAPALIYEEGDLIQRTIRDTHNADIEEILIEGKDAYRHAKEIMKKLAPSHVKRVQSAPENEDSLFQKYNIHAQVDAMFDPVVPLKSGGYLVMNITEALVAIDVNSGRSTKDRHIEETAFRTNMEAAEEVARQLRLRDMAGIVVIDFIDMREQKNIASVERKFRDAIKQDRARIQVGHISMFGLLELSRQRLRPSIVETASHKCPTCEGTGMVRSAESTALQALRALEARGKEMMKTEEGVSSLILYLPRDVAYYLMNQKRKELVYIEQALDVAVEVREDPDLHSYHYRLLTNLQAEKVEEKDKETLERKITDLEKEMNITRPSENSGRDQKREDGGRVGGKSRRRRGGKNREDTNSQKEQEAPKLEQTKGKRRPKKSRDSAKESSNDPFVVHGGDDGEENTSSVLLSEFDNKADKSELAADGSDEDGKNRNRRRRTRSNRRRSRGPRQEQQNEAKNEAPDSNRDTMSEKAEEKKEPKHQSSSKSASKKENNTKTDNTSQKDEPVEKSVDSSKKTSQKKSKDGQTSGQDNTPDEQSSTSGRKRGGWLKRLLDT